MINKSKLATRLGDLSVGEFLELLQESQKINREYDLINIIECAKIVGYSCATIRKKVHEKSIPFHIIDKRTMFSKSEIENWLNNIIN